MITSGFSPFLPSDWQSRLSVMELDPAFAEPTSEATKPQIDQLEDSLNLRDDERP